MSSPREAEHPSSSDARVLLVDDHELVRRGVHAFLRDQGGFDVVGEAGTMEEAIQLVGEVGIDVALIDLRLPDGSGIELCREIKQRDTAVACMIFTSFDDDSAYLDAAYAGADAYVTKDRSGQDLVVDIHRVLRGDSLMDARRVANLVEVSRASQQALEVLTDNEYRILQLIGAGLTNRQIAERLYLAEQTVKNYVSRLLAKLGLQTRMEAVLFAQDLPDRDASE